MPFPAPLDLDAQTTKRGGCFTERYLIVHTPTIQLQFNPSEAASENVTGEIPYTTVLSGSYVDALLGMTVIISPTSDYTADLRNQPENCFMTYIRLMPTETMLRIGATKYQFGTGDFVTVLDDYRIFERKLRAVSAFDVRRDWDVLFRSPKPRIYNLYSQVVFASDVVASIDLAPLAECMAASGTISNWLWRPADGIITVGSTTSQDITVEFPIGTRYVHLTVTDSNAVANYLTALIVVLPPDLSSVIKLDNGSFSIEKSLESGNRGSFTALNDGTWLDGSQAIVATFAHYADGETSLTTTLIAWLKDMSDTLSADEELGYIKETSATMEGIAYYASQLQSEGFYTELKNSPLAWGEFTRLTPYDALWYLLSEHSTLANVAAIDFEADHSDYKFTTINIPSGTMDEVANNLAFRAMGGTINYSPNGELVFRKSLLYYSDDGDRDAAETYASYTLEDILTANYSRIINFEIKAVGQILMGCALYNTTTRIPRVYFAKAPAGDESGYLIEELDSIILPANTTDANAKDLAGRFTANHYFAINENPIIAATLVDGYHTLEPSAFQWQKFTVDETDTVTGAALTEDERFICTELSIEYNDEIGALVVSASFRKETNGGANYLQEAIYVPTNSPNIKPFVPQYVPQPFLDTGLEEEDTYDTGNNNDTGNGGVQDPSLPPAQAGQAQGAPPYVLETLYVPLFSNDAIFSVNNLIDDASYILRITGDGKLTHDATEVTIDWSLGDQLGWIPYTDPIATGGLPAADWDGDGWVNVFFGPFPSTFIENTFTWPSDTLFTKAQWYIANKVGAVAHTLAGLPAPNAVGNGEWPVADGGGDSVIVIEDIDKGTRTGFLIAYFRPVATNTKIYKAVFTYEGSAPSLAGVSVEIPGVRGDAWWWQYNISSNQQYPALKGLYVNGALPSPIPSFSASHVYELPFTGTGVTVPFQFYDPDNDYTDNDNSYLKVEIIAL